MTAFRLRPFCSWTVEGDRLVLKTPEKQITMRVVEGLEELLCRLQGGWVYQTPLVQALAAHDIVTSTTTGELQTLWRLDEYFRETDVTADLIRQGTRHPGYELGRACYCLQTGSAIVGYGQDANPELAMVKAAAEVYERLSCFRERNDGIITPNCSLPEVDWRRFVSYKGWQEAVPGFEKGRTPAGWVEVQKVFTGQRFRLPEEMVFLNSRKRPPLAVVNSSGVACHPSYEQALFRSVYELIERDALMVRWFREEPCDQIVPPSELQERLGRLEDLGYKCLFLSLTMEFAPVILAILRGSEDKFPRLVLGMASHPNPLQAMIGALEEVELNVTFAGLEVRAVDSAQAIRSVADHQLWYDRPENHSLVMSLVSEEKIGLDTITPGPASAEGVLDCLSREGLSWYAAALNQTGYDSTGIHTIRSIVPGLTPIGFGYTMEPLGVERLHHPIPSMGWGASCSPRTTREGYVVQPFA